MYSPLNKNVPFLWRLVKKIPVISTIYILWERLRSLENRCQDLEESINEIILGADPAETMLTHQCRCNNGFIPDFRNQDIQRKDTMAQSS